MKEGPDISRIAALIGDPARANMLTALMDGRALTASELAVEAGVTKQTASTHLSRLLQGGLLARDVQGRHHYFRLDGPEIAAGLEALMGIAQTRSGGRTRAGPREPALRKARVCYDHLAGEFGVLLFERFVENGWLTVAGSDVALTVSGRKRLDAFGLDTDRLLTGRRKACRSCLDWSMRRYHLAGSVGQGILERITGQGWARRIPDTRIVDFSPDGEKAFQAWLCRSISETT